MPSAKLIREVHVEVHGGVLMESGERPPVTMMIDIEERELARGGTEGVVAIRFEATHGGTEVRLADQITLQIPTEVMAHLFAEEDIR